MYSAAAHAAARMNILLHVFWVVWYRYMYDMYVLSVYMMFIYDDD